MMQILPTPIMCNYYGMVCELVEVDAAKRRGIIRALHGYPFGFENSDVTSDLCNVALSHLTITPVGVGVTRDEI